MMGGLISSTALTLLVVPLLYTFLDDLTLKAKQLVATAFATRTPEVAEHTADD
jgi:hypothetical protein